LRNSVIMVRWWSYAHVCYCYHPDAMILYLHREQLSSQNTNLMKKNFHTIVKNSEESVTLHVFVDNKNKNRDIELCRISAKNYLKKTVRFAYQHVFATELSPTSYFDGKYSYAFGFTIVK